MSSSKSSPTNTTSTTTNASETNLAATNTQGVTLLGSSGNTLNSVTNNTSSDEGAIAAGTTLGQLAIASNTGLSETLATESSDFANHALDVISQTQSSSANLVSQVLSQGLGFLTSNEQQVVDLAKENQDANNAQLGNVATTLASIAQANDTTAASQSTAFAQTVLKYGAIALLGVGVLIVIYSVAKK